jgi:ligand-binding sensor domain-containing protein
LNTGVSVFNGKDWKNYDVVDGPIGERIFDIKICPKDSDVWIATSAGISRYKIYSMERCSDVLEFSHKHFHFKEKWQTGSCIKSLKSEIKEEPRVIPKSVD